MWPFKNNFLSFPAALLCFMWVIFWRPFHFLHPFEYPSYHTYYYIDKPAWRGNSEEAHILKCFSVPPLLIEDCLFNSAQPGWGYWDTTNTFISQNCPRHHLLEPRGSVLLLKNNMHTHTSFNNRLRGCSGAYSRVCVHTCVCHFHLCSLFHTCTINELFWVSAVMTIIILGASIRRHLS